MILDRKGLELGRYSPTSKRGLQSDGWRAVSRLMISSLAPSLLCADPWYSSVGPW